MSILKSELDWARKMEWSQSIWKCKPALVELNGGSSRPYIGQKFDDKFFKIVEDFWTHEHCSICVEGIHENDMIFISDNNIICNNCYLDFIIPENIELVIREMKKVER